jgi:hypothetical protein
MPGVHATGSRLAASALAAHTTTAAATASNTIARRLPMEEASLLTMAPNATRVL